MLHKPTHLMAVLTVFISWRLDFLDYPLFPFGGAAVSVIVANTGCITAGWALLLP